LPAKVDKQAVSVLAFEELIIFEDVVERWKGSHGAALHA
jgi:hypothetical protein